MQIQNGKTKAKKSMKNRFGEGLGPHLGGVWDSLGCLLCTFRRFLNVSLVFEIALFSSIGLRWGPRGLLDQFWMVFGRFWEVFGWILGDFGKVLGRFSMSGPPRCLAKPRGASQCAGVLDPPACWMTIHQPPFPTTQPPLGGASPPSEEASRMPSRFLYRSFWEGLGPLFRIFSHFFRIFGES